MFVSELGIKYAESNCQEQQDCIYSHSLSKLSILQWQLAHSLHTYVTWPAYSMEKAFECRHW